MMNAKFAAIGMLFASALPVLSGCSAPGASKAQADPEAYLAARAEQRWGHLINAEYDKAYALLTPGYREVNELESYRQLMVSRQINWTAAQAERVECDSADRCTVHVRIDYKVIGGIPGVRDMAASQTSREVWLNLGDDWYHLPPGGRG